MPDGLRYLSTTLINGWLDCPSRAWRSYARRLDMGDDNEGTDSTRFGTAVHNTLEHFHNLTMVEEKFTDKDVLDYFDTQFAMSGCLDPELYTLAQDVLVDFLNRTINERHGTTVATELAFVLDVEANTVLVADDRKGLEVEIERILALGHTPVVSKIDRVDIAHKDDGIHVEVYDYKTNILPFTREYVENSKQLGIYDLVARALYPEAASVTCIFDMVRHGRFPVEFGEHARATLRRYLPTLWQQINQTKTPEERINKYCRWCEVRGNCSAYKAVLGLDALPIITEVNDSDEAINASFDELEHLGDLNKIIEKRIDEIKGMLSAKIIHDNLGEPLQAGNRELYLSQNSRPAIDTVGVVEVFRAHDAITLLPQVVTAQKTAIDRFIKARPEYKAELTKLVRKTFVSPSLKSRSLIGGKSTDAPESD